MTSPHRVVNPDGLAPPVADDDVDEHCADAFADPAGPRCGLLVLG